MSKKRKYVVNSKKDIEMDEFGRKPGCSSDADDLKVDIKTTDSHKHMSYNEWNENKEYEKIKYEREVKNLFFPCLIPYRKFLRERKHILEIIFPVFLFIIYILMYFLMNFSTPKEYQVFLIIPFFINLAILLMKALLIINLILPDFIAERRCFYLRIITFFILIFNFLYLFVCRILIYYFNTKFDETIIIECSALAQSIFLAYSYTSVYDLEEFFVFKIYILFVSLFLFIVTCIFVPIDRIFIFFVFTQILILLINFVSFLSHYENKYWSENTCFSLFFYLHIVFLIENNNLRLNFN
ncbi:hypothetical protein TUBRATIS_10020 [Tubulinosema ratisbonensis]|uniref:Uncharacterized protein n=1 Tax=Tubulinosema ratisbonensis TaxID=291195 RepID=A0A437AMQ7_9MICR|nr:hypothetical protein TUBRATIS_10020 [Tubulinosema ratisbonensis]